MGLDDLPILHSPFSIIAGRHILPAMPARKNPLLQPWTGPYGGVPPFDRVKVEHFRPALEAAMQSNLDEIERIASNPEPPTFENTIAAQEGAGRTMTQVSVVFSV